MIKKWLMIFNFQRGWFNHQLAFHFCVASQALGPGSCWVSGYQCKARFIYRHFWCLHNGSAINKAYGICKYFYYIDSDFFTLFLQPLFYFVRIFNIGISQQKSVPHGHSPFSPADYVTSRNYVIRCWFIVGSWAILSKRRISHVFSPLFSPQTKNIHSIL